MSGILGIIGAVTGIINRIIPDPDKRMELQLALEELKARPEFAQIEVNQIEAANPNLFVSGWRPAVGWIGVIGLSMAYVVQPFLAAILPEASVPHFPLEHMMDLVYAMLGLGAMRSFDKFKKTAR